MVKVWVGKDSGTRVVLGMVLTLAILTILVFIAMWYTSSKAMKLGKEQKGQQMMLYIYIFIFLTAIFTLLNLAHLFI